MTKDAEDLLNSTFRSIYDDDHDYDGSAPLDSSMDTTFEVVSSMTSQTLKQGESADLYHAGIIINSKIANMASSMPTWPPPHSLLSIESSEKSVPPELYNLVAMITGSIDIHEPPTNDRFVPVANNHYKILSICQDIIHIENRRNLTPKSLALGLTLRHLTGSSQVSNLVHSFGHCASYDTVVRYETALALQRDEDTCIPSEMCEKGPTMVIWDNIDFDEETVSGAGTTHHTNGVLVQALSAGERIHVEPALTSRRCRTVKVGEAITIPYHTTPKQTPMHLSGSHHVETSTHAFESTQNPVRLDQAFTWIKSTTALPEMLPGWTGFNRQLSTKVEKSLLHYLPVIEDSPTNMTTINTILYKTIDIANKLKLDQIVLVCDQAIYAKAQQIRWKDESLRNRLVLRLGEFHTSMSYMAVLGKRFGPAGLQDLMIEAGIVAPGSINGVVSGHNYNRSIRAHKLTFEALDRLRFTMFLDTISPETADRYMSLLNKMESAYPDAQFQQYLIGDDFTYLMQEYAQHVSAHSASNPTYAFWSSYIDMVQTLLMFIRATRQSDWNLHVDTIRLMLPWYFAYDRVNYAR